MARASCHECGENVDTRSMEVCPGCRNYICSDCYRDHRSGCETE